MSDDNRRVARPADADIALVMVIQINTYTALIKQKQKTLKVLTNVQVL